MFILRTVHTDKSVSNLSIGGRYTFIGAGDSPDEFNKWFQHVFNKEHGKSEEDFDNKVFAFLLTESKGTVPIYDCDRNYIMRENRSTFENLNAFAVTP